MPGGKNWNAFAFNSVDIYAYKVVVFLFGRNFQKATIDGFFDYPKEAHFPTDCKVVQK